MFPRRSRRRSPREHPRDFRWQGIWKHSAGSVRVEVVFLPRLLLLRLLRGGLVSKRKLHERMALFNAGDWAQLLLESNSTAEAGTQAAVRKRRQHVQDDISPSGWRCWASCQLAGRRLKEPPLPLAI